MDTESVHSFVTFFYGRALLIPVEMPEVLQTKCKTCFGGPTMILYGFWENKYLLWKGVCLFGPHSPVRPQDKLVRLYFWKIP